MWKNITPSGAWTREYIFQSSDTDHYANWMLRYWIIKSV